MLIGAADLASDVQHEVGAAKAEEAIATIETMEAKVLENIFEESVEDVVDLKC